MESSPASQQHVSYGRSRGMSRLYHVGKGFVDFGSQVYRFRTVGLATATLLAIGSVGALVIAAPLAFPLAIAGIGVAAGVPLGIATRWAGHKMKNWSYDHRSALYERQAESWRKTGVALATAIACVPGVYAGYQVYKDSPAPDAREATLPSHSLKTAFDQGLTEKTVSQPVAAVSSASKLVIR